MAQTVQPEVFVNYISQRKKIVVNAHNQPTQLLIQTDYNLNDTLYFQVINVNNRIVELDVNTTYQLYGTYIDAKKQVHILFYTLGVTPRDNMLSFLVNTYTSEYLAYVKNNRTPIDISIVAKQNVGGSTKSYMVLRDSALANPRGYIEGQAPTDIVYQNVFNSQIPVSTAFGAGNNINLAQDLEGQEIYSFAFGDTLSTNNANQFVIGYNNEPDATKAFIVANDGNIFTVDYEGNVEANSISTTTLYINGEEIGQSVDDKVDQLSTAFDDKLSATEDWVSDTFETKESATQTFNELEEDIDSISSFVSGLPTDIAAKADQTDLDEANQKIDTISGQVEYLSGAIDQHTSDIGDLNNAVSAKANQTDLEALSTTVEGLAETKADLSSVYTKEEVYTYIETDVKINEATSGKADLSTVQAVDDKFANYYTSAQVDDAISTAIDEIDIPSTVYTGEDGIKVENGVISLTATLSSITNDAGFITSADIPTSYVQQSELESVSGQLTNAIGAKADTTQVEAEFTATSAWANETFLTEHQSLDNYYNKTEVDTTLALKADSADVYTKTEVNNISTNIISQIPTDVATSTYVQAASGNAVSVATGWVQDKNYLSSINVIQQDTDFDENTSKLFFNAGFSLAQTEDMVRVDIDTNSIATQEFVTGQVSGKADQSTVEGLSTALSTAIDTKANSADVYTKSEVYTKGETDTAINTATSGKVNKSDFDTVTGALSSAIDTKTTSGEVKTQIEAYGYQNATDVANAISGKADKSELQSVSGTLNTAIGGVSDRVGAIEADYTTSAQVSSIVEGYDFATEAEIPTTVAELTDASDYALKSELPSDYTTSAQVSSIVESYNYITAEGIPNTYALKTDVDTASGAAVNAATGWVNVQDYLTEVPSEYITETELTTELTAYATSGWVDQNYAKKGEAPTDVYTKAEVNAISSALSSTVSEAGYLTEVPNTVSAAAVDVATGWVDVQNYLTEVPNTYALKTDIQTNDEITGLAKDYVDTLNIATTYATKDELSSKTTSAQVSAIVTGFNYLTGITVEDAYDQTYHVSSLILNDDFSYYDQLYWNGLFVDNQAGQGNGDYRAKKLVFSNDFSIYFGDEVSEISINSDILSSYATQSWVGEQGFASASDIPTTVSELTNDSNYISAITLSAYNASTMQNEAVQTTTIDLASTDFVTWNGKVYINDNKFDIPTDAEISGIASAVASAYVEGSTISAVSQLINDVGFVTEPRVSAIASAYAQGGGGTTYTAGDGIDISNDEISVKLSGGNNVTLSTDATGLITINATGGGSTINVTVEDRSTEQQVTAPASSVYFTENGFNGVISNNLAQIQWKGIYGLDSNEELIDYEKGIQWSEDFSVGTSEDHFTVSLTNPIPTNVSDLTNDSGYQTAAQVSAIASAYAEQGGGGTTYTAGDYISLANDTIAVTGLPSQIEYISSVVSAIPTGSEQTNQQTISTGFTYDSKLEIAKNTYTPTDGVVTLSAFEVPAGSLDSNKAATFEEWVYANGNLTGFAFDGVTLIGELPEEISQTNYYVFTRRILGSGDQLISLAYTGINQFYIPLTFTGKAATNSVLLSSIGSPDSVTLQYSKNGGEWTNYSIGNSISLNQNQTVAFSGANDHFSKDSGSNYYQFKMTGTIEAKGNIQSLMNYSNTVAHDCYYNMFRDCTSLITAPNLPATTLAERCYRTMFRGTSLTTAPQLPAITLANNCYTYMFVNCSALTAAPELPATGLANSCYEQMFGGCSSLLSARLPATTLVYSCYLGMFVNCSNLSSIEVAFTNWAQDNTYATWNWVDGVASTGTFKKPSALNAKTGTNNIPSNWTIVNKD